MPGGIQVRNDQTINIQTPDFVRPQWTLFPVFNVRGKDFGATGDGVTDDRAAIQRAVDAAKAGGGGIVFFPPGTYKLVKSGGGTTGPIPLISMVGCNNIWLLGSGMDATVLQRAAGTYNNDTHIIVLDGGSDIYISDMTLDGNRANCTDGDEQRHGLYISGLTADITNVICERVKFKSTRGDGIFMIGDLPVATRYLYKQIMIQNCRFIDNARSGGAHQAGGSFIWWLDNYFELASNGDQDLDFETTGSPAMTDLVVSRNFFNHTNAAISVALTGFDGTSRMERAIFANNVMKDGALFVRYVDGMQIINNHIVGPDDNRAFDCQVGCFDLLIQGNYVEGNYADEPALRADTVSTTSTNIRIKDNIVVQNDDGAAGILAFNYDWGVVITGNDVTGPGGTQYGIDFGVETASTGTVYDYVCDGNEVKNFGTGIRLRCGNNATNEMHTVSICNNRLYDTQGTPSQTTGILLDSNNNANFIAEQSITIADNVFGEGITTPVSNSASVTPICVGGLGANNGGAFGIALWLCIGTPEAQITARIGSLAMRQDGGAGTSLYVKEANTDNTGWAGK